MPVDAAAAKSVFLAALEKQDPDERANYLDQACAGDTELRDRVDALLKGHESGSFPDFLADAAPAFDATQSVVNTPTDETHTSADATAGAASLGFLSPPSNPANLGRLDHYEVLSVLGQGGMGVVLKAFDESLDRIVAIKVLGSQYAANGTARKRFIREAKAVAAVSHEHVVHVYAVDERVPYLVMQYIKGVSLQDRIDKSGPLELHEILRIGLQIASGLAAAHAQGIVHRDIKPSNILLENGIERVKLTDFGLARAVDDASVTQSGVIAGTPMYMSPEQARGEQVDPRSDLFSLGSVLYAMCTGHAPFRASGTMAVMKRVIEDSPRSICEQHPDTPEWLEAIVFKLLAKHPDDRFHSAKEVAQLLEQHLAHLQQPSAVAMPAPIDRPRPRTSRRPAPVAKRSSFPGWAVAVIVLIVAAPCVLLVGAIGFFWLMPFQSDPPNRDTHLSSTGPNDWGGMVVQPASKPSLTLHLDHPGLRVVTVGEDGTNYECKKDAFLATVGELPPGRYHTRVYRPDNPEVLVAQKTFELIVPGHAFEFRVDSNWTQLFNGQDLTGWKVFPEDRKSWKVVDGVLTGKGAPSHLFSERGDYASFHLRMEMRVNKSGACGHWSRVPFGDPRILHYPYGDGSLYTTPVAALYSKDGVTRDPGQPRNRPSSLMVSGVGWGSDGPKNVLKIPENEWFISEVILDGNTLMIKSPRLSQSNPYFRGSATEGHLALQLFDSESVVEYRNIEIKEIKGSTRDEDRLQGSWHAVGGEFAGLKLSDDELKLAKLAFTGEQMRGTFPPKGLAGEGSFKLNPMASPKQITVKATGSSNSTLEGIYRFEGERLVLCMGGGADQRPTEFSSKGARSYGVLVLERDTVSPVADEKRLQGNWKIVGHEEGGVPLSARLIPSPEVMSIAIAGDRASLKSSVPLKVGGDVSPKVTWEGVFHVDPKASPKRINVFIPGDNKNSMIGIYRFDGDRLVLCFISNPIKLEYPTEFATQKGDGLVMMTLEKFESKSVTPFELTPPKVLPHMVGTWSFEMERQSTADGKERGKSMGLVVVEPVAGGEHFAIRTQSSDGGPSGLSIITLDKQSSRFKSRFFDPSGYVSDTASGDFDAKAKVLLMTNTTKDNLVLTRRQTFINADTIEMKVTTHDKAGKVVFEGKGMMRRLPKGRAIDEAAVEAQLVPKEMAQLERFVGTWDLEFRSRIRPDNRWQAELTIRKVLGGRFIETREVVPLTGEQHIMLATYDAEKKVYYHWYWSSVQPQAEGPSTWDEGTKSLKWEGKVGDESAMTRSSSVVWKFTTGDKIELRVAIKDKDGAVIDELEGTHTRRAKSK